jgi:hypothetical protein
MVLPLGLTQTLDSMTTAEQSSLTWNAVLRVVDRLNSVSAGNGATLTYTDVVRTTLSTAATRHHRRSGSNTVYLTAFFDAAQVTSSEATSAAATVTSANPVVVFYDTSTSSVGTATATSASARAGTASPTAAPTTAPKASEDALDTTRVALVVAAAAAIALLILAAVVYKVRQSKNSATWRDTEAKEPARMRLDIVSTTTTATYDDKRTAQSSVV